LDLITFLDIADGLTWCQEIVIFRKDARKKLTFLLVMSGATILDAVAVTRISDV
jgi:hypothetical protein